jgi:hypothetical protein
VADTFGTRFLGMVKAPLWVSGTIPGYHVTSVCTPDFILNSCSGKHIVDNWLLIAYDQSWPRDRHEVTILGNLDGVQDMKTRTIRLSEAEYAELSADCGGVCLACGEIQWGGCEPDARNYPCESCGQNRVFGVEEALMMGRVEFTEDGECECDD